MEKGYVIVSGNRISEVYIVRQDHDFVVVQIPGTESRWRVRRTKVFPTLEEAESFQMERFRKQKPPQKEDISGRAENSMKNQVEGWGTFRSPH